MKDSVEKAMHIAKMTLGTAAFAFLSSYITTNFLVGLALDRRSPKIPAGAEKIFVGGGISEDFLRTLDEAAARLDRQDNETIHLTAHDGTPLTGHWIPCPEPKRILIAMHGWRSTWQRDFGMFSDFWAKNGCSVLYVEQRGQGESGGEYMGFGLMERYDCLDWVHWVNDRFGTELPIYLWGMSMGAATVLMAAGLDLPENVHGICADCGFTSPAAIWRHIASDNLHMLYGIRGKIADELCKKKIDMSADEYSTVDALKRTKVPVLLVHGTDDTFVPVTMTYENYKACASPKKLLVVPGAEHGMSYYVERENYEAAVLDFWRQHDA